MIFVLDNNVFSDTLKNIPFDSFQESVYQPVEDLIHTGIVISVEEVFKELEVFFGKKEEEFKWLKGVKKCFQYLDNTDCANLMKIYENKKFQESIKEKSIRAGSPEADAMIVAKAMSLNGIVVTNESNRKAHAEKIPNMCVEFDIKYIKKNDFYKVLKNHVEGKSLLDNVKVLSILEVPEKKSSEVV